MNRKALGRGLGALLSSDRTVDLHDEPYEVEIDLIDAGSMQPRTYFDPVSLAGLADSIKSHGVVQPLLVAGEAVTAINRDSGRFRIATDRRIFGRS